MAKLGMGASENWMRKDEGDLNKLMARLLGNGNPKLGELLQFNSRGFMQIRAAEKGAGAEALVAELQGQVAVCFTLLLAIAEKLGGPAEA